VRRVFADTFYWVALIHRKDAGNKAALEWSRETASVHIVTTEEVLTEVLAFCSSDEGLRADAVKIVRSILSARTGAFSSDARASRRTGRSGLQWRRG
jgi:predicted nucleic acid-binding protein